MRARFSYVVWLRNEPEVLVQGFSYEDAVENARFQYGGRVLLVVRPK